MKGGESPLTATDALWGWISLATLSVAYLLVPRHRFFSFLLPGVVLGALLALAINLVGDSVLRLWIYPPSAFSVAGVPLLMATMWIGEVILFLHFFPERGWDRALWLLAASLAVTFLDFLLVSYGFRRFINWSLAGTFVLAVFSHVVVVVFTPLFAALCSPRR